MREELEIILDHAIHQNKILTKRRTLGEDNVLNIAVFQLLSQCMSETVLPT